MRKHALLIERSAAFLLAIAFSGCVATVEPATPLQTGPQEPALVTAVEQGNKPEISGLIASGTDLNTRAYDGATALHRAAELGEVETVRDLIAHGANPKMLDEVGNTVLHRAAFSRKPELLEYLLSLGLDPNAQNEAGTTALLIVTARNDLASAKVLLAHGAQPVFSHSLSPSPLKLARSRGFSELVGLYEGQVR